MSLALTLSAENTIDYDILMANGDVYENTDTGGTPYQILSLKLYIYK